MLYDTIGPFPKKSDTPCEKVRKASGDLDGIKNEQVTTIDPVVKEGTTDTVVREVKKTNVVGKSITSPISVLENIDTVNKTEKSQASNKTVDTSRSNKIDTVLTLINQGLFQELFV